jgi:hypothetical protein
VLAFYRGRGRAGEVGMGGNRWLNGLQAIDGREGLIRFREGGFMAGELDP